MDDDKQLKTITKGRRAQSLIDSQAFREATEAVKQGIKDDWSSPRSSPQERERLWEAYQMADRYELAITKAANNGKMAQMDLDRLAGRK